MRRSSRYSFLMPKKKAKRRAKKKNKSFRAPKVGGAFEKLVNVMARLRSPGGCPWDREQTHATLRTYLIEEAYEVLDALESTDDAKFAEELGDLLLQVLFHAQIAHEENRFDISDVIREIYEKMIRRHPHVFGTARANTAAEVLHNWEQIKQQERKDGKEVKDKTKSSASAASSTSSTSFPSSASVLDGVPRALPALVEALQLTRKAARIGFDWHGIEGIFEKLSEETQELKTALATARSSGSSRAGGRKSSRAGRGESSKGAAGPSSSIASPSIESELGDILFVAVNLARFLNLDPEIALKKTSNKFSRRFREMERMASEQGTTLAKIPRPEMESLWDRAKLQERDSSQR
jgi:nucleoside triphosphate diphosphatase